jgi:hypothetical protein
MSLLHLCQRSFWQMKCLQRLLRKKKEKKKEEEEKEEEEKKRTKSLGLWSPWQ